MDSWRMDEIEQFKNDSKLIFTRKLSVANEQKQPMPVNNNNREWGWPFDESASLRLGDIGSLVINSATWRPLGRRGPTRFPFSSKGSKTEWHSAYIGKRNYRTTWLTMPPDVKLNPLWLNGGHLHLSLTESDRYEGGSDLCPLLMLSIRIDQSIRNNDENKELWIVQTNCNNNKQKYNNESCFRIS